MKELNYIKLEFPSRSSNEAFARSAAAAFAAQLDPNMEEMGDIRTAVSEAVTNSIVHGYKFSEGIIYIGVKYFSDRRVVIDITDKGCGIENVAQAMTPLFTTDTSGERSGMGFAVMQTFMDKLIVKSKLSKGVRIQMTKQLK